MYEAQYYSIENKESLNIICQLCPRYCFIKPGAYGFCGVRHAGKTGVFGESGKLYSIIYGKVVALHVDPIEKKPLNRFFPGSKILSIGTHGCNLDCSFCQNYLLACKRGENISDDIAFIAPEMLCTLVHEKNESIGIAYTYNEPLVWYEYMYDSASLLKQKYPDKKTLLVTNGFINKEPFSKLLPFIDAINFDFKGGQEFYKNICHGEKAYQTIKQSMMMAFESACHIEVTFLAIDGENSDDETIVSLIEILTSINPEIPLHINRYYPARNMNKLPTKRSTLDKLYTLASEKLKYVYIGNVH